MFNPKQSQFFKGVEIWNGILTCRSIITDLVTWKRDDTEMFTVHTCSGVSIWKFALLFSWDWAEERSCSSENSLSVIIKDPTSDRLFRVSYLSGTQFSLVLSCLVLSCISGFTSVLLAWYRRVKVSLFFKCFFTSTEIVWTRTSTSNFTHLLISEVSLFKHCCPLTVGDGRFLSAKQHFI